MQLGLRIDMAQACLGRVVVGLGLVEVSAIVLVVDAKQHVTGAHALVVPDLDRGYVAGHLGR
ncbi:hypothetical protein D3C76_1524480 [compost metagenome]